MVKSLIGSRLSEKRVAWIILVLVVGFNAIALFPEISISRFDLNDSIFHYTLADRVTQAFDRGENPLDFWVSEWTLGYPVFRTYQPLGHLLIAIIDELLRKTIPLMTIFVWIRCLLVVLLPVSVYLAARKLRLPPAASAAAAMISPLVSTDALFGIEYGSYVWRGSGLFSQALAMHFLFLGVGSTAKAVRGESKGTAAGVLLGLAFLSHFIYGYIGAVTACLIALIPGTLPLKRRLARVAIIGAISLCVSGFELVPMLADTPLVNHSRWEPAWKWDSFGASSALTQLVTGKLLDFGRLPVLSVLALIGGSVCLFRIKRSGIEPNTFLPGDTAVLLSAGTGLWLTLFFGRPAWGGLLKFIAPQDLQLHRLIGGLHLFLILIAGLGLAEIWRWIQLRKRRFGNAILVAATVVILLPAARERYSYLAENAEWGRSNEQAFAAEQTDIDHLIAEAQRAPGRIYPGLAAQWGKDFRVGSVPIYGLLSTHHVPSVAALYHAMALTSDIMVLFDEGNPAHYELFNISTVISDGRTLPGFIRPTRQVGRFQIGEVPSGGYFEIVRVPYAMPSNKATFYNISANWLQSDWMPDHVHLLLDFGQGGRPDIPMLAPGETLPEPIIERPAGTVESEHRRDETYGAKVHLDRAGYVLFKMTYHPNWIAMVDGKPARTFMVTPGFIAFPVEEGEHQIEMIYSPGAMKWLLLLSGLIALALLIAFQNIPLRKARSVHEE